MKPHHWYVRPVLFVSDLQSAIRFYIDQLGFAKSGMPATARGRSAGMGSMSFFGALGTDSESMVGYDVIRIVDPDGNELLFPLDETNDGERQT